LKCSVERMKAGGNHWAWDPEEDQWYGVVPRRGGKPEDIVWFRASNAFHGHVAGCYENEDSNIVFDLTVADGNVFFFFPPDTHGDDSLAKRNSLRSETQRWIFDPRSPTNTTVKPSIVWDTSGEFSRIDDRYVTKQYNHFWQARIDPSREYDFEACGPPAGGLFNCVGHYTWDGRTEDVFWAGPRATFQEPTFIPKENGTEGEGWIIALLNHLDVLRNDVVILDAQNIAKGPVATIHLPLKLKLGLHGNFVDHRDIEAWQDRRAPGGEVGPVKAADKPLAWQTKVLEESHSKTNGVNGTKGVNGTNGVNGANGTALPSS